MKKKSRAATQQRTDSAERTDAVTEVSKVSITVVGVFAAIVGIWSLACIIGGIGSLPGVVVGALILVGLPELLREFAEYRLLMYGALLVVMMLARPEGFVPSAIKKRELTTFEGEIDQPEPEMGAAGD